MARVGRRPLLGAVITALTALFLAPVLTAPGGVAVTPSDPGAVVWHPGAAVPILAPSGGPLFPVNFTEAGLGPASSWTVTLGNWTQSSTNRSITFYVPNGTYAFSVGSVRNMVPTRTDGSVTVLGGNNSVLRTLNVPGSRPYGGAVLPWTGNVYMAYDQVGNLSIINGTTHVNRGSLPVGRSPDAPIWDPVARAFYVANFGSDNLTVIDPATHAEVANVPVGHQPLTAAFDPATNWIYVADYGGNSVTVLNGTNVTDATVITTLEVGMQPAGMAYDPLTQEVYVANFGSNNVSVIGGAPAKVQATIPLPASSGPYGLAYDPADQRLFVTDRGAAACPGGGSPCTGSLLNASTDAYVGSFVEGPSAAFPAFDPNNGLVYVPNDLHPGTLTVLSSASTRLVATIAVGDGPETVTVDPGVDTAYSANNVANSITIIDARTYDESVSFVPRPSTLYAVNLTETGLPTNASWSVSVNGTRFGATGPMISLSEPNGTYPFVAGNVTGYRVAPGPGSLTVQGSDVTAAVAYLPLPPPTYAVSFVETGLAPGIPWSVDLEGTLATSGGATIGFARANGTYDYVVPPVRGYLGPDPGSLTVNGTGIVATVAFSVSPPARFAVEFRERGLPTSTDWWVTVGSATIRGSSSVLAMNESNGTYAFTAGAVGGFAEAPSSGLLRVNGSSETLSVWFNASARPGPGGSMFSWGNGNYGFFGRSLIAFLAFLVSAALAISVSLILLTRRRRSAGTGTTVASVAAESGLPLRLGAEPTEESPPEGPGSDPPEAFRMPPPPSPPAASPPDWSEN